jgi:phage tail sheath gpL-like
MVASIQLTGLAANDPVPGEYAEISFAQGESSLGTNTYSAILLGNMLSSGSATPDTVVYGPDTPVTMTSEQDAISLFGEGSELHRMVRRFLTVNKTTPLYAIGIDDGYSGGAGYAEGLIELTGPATGAGTLRVYVGDEFVDVGFVTNDTASDIASDAAAAINSKTHWAVTAVAVLGDVQLTAKQAGLRGNFIRYFAQVLPTTAGIVATPTASTNFINGTVSDDNTTALATILPERYYYIVSAAEDVTQLTSLVSQVNTQSLPVTGIRQRVFAGAVGTLAASITVSDALNAPRAEITWLNQSDLTPGELATNSAAIYSLEESGLRFECNFDSYGQNAKTSVNWKIRAPLSGAKPTRSQIYAALNAGLTPIGVDKSSSYLVKRITTRYKNGSVVDYRIRDAHKVTVCDRYTDDLLAKMASTLRGKKIGDDPVKNEPTPGPDVVTPRIAKALINRLTTDYGEIGLLQNVNEIKANTIVIREVSPRTRLSARIPLQPIDILDQVTTKIDQVS